jgi:hypothetical protein
VPSSSRGHVLLPCAPVILPGGAPKTERWYDWDFYGGFWRRERFGTGNCEDGRGVGFISPHGRTRHAREICARGVPAMHDDPLRTELMKSAHWSVA